LEYAGKRSAAALSERDAAMYFAEPRLRLKAVSRCACHALQRTASPWMVIHRLFTSCAKIMITRIEFHGQRSIVRFDLSNRNEQL
jgi:hypothetical protein